MIKQLYNKSEQIFLSKIKYLYPRVEQNPVLVNSFPKSGTHLLYQIFWKFNHLYKFKTFIASHPSTYKSERKNKTTNLLIENILNGELVRGHIFYNEMSEKILINKNIIHIFIYRDPRDVVISEANYLNKMNKFHYLYKYFSKINNLNDRITFSIKGNDFIKTNGNYKNIYNRYMDYINWIKSENCYCIKYEDLVGINKKKHLLNIIEYYLKNSKFIYDKEELVKIVEKSIDPNKSHTFHSGGTQKWKTFFNDENKKLFKDYAGDLLIKLGYEKDYDW